MKKNAEFLAAFIKEQTGIALKVAEGDGGRGHRAPPGAGADSPEAYRLKVDDRKVEISAPSEAGVFYGIQTLRKSVSVHEGAGAVELPAVEINDSPRFSYRGMMLDVGRHMFSMDENQERTSTCWPCTTSTASTGICRKTRMAYRNQEVSQADGIAPNAARR